MAYIFDSLKYKDLTVAWIREFFRENGPGCKAVLGISGGKDSSVCAALCVEALGRENVVGVLMPNRRQNDIDVALRLCNFLGIKYYVVDIGEAYDGLADSIRQNCDFELSKQTLINMAPRIRMSCVYAVSQSVNGRVVNTCNLSEDWVGYSTRYGDSVGDFSPLSRFTVAEVRELGLACGLPEDIVYKAPSDGLTGLTDEDNLGFTYSELDKYIREGVIDNLEHKALIDKKHRQNLFKLALMPVFENDIEILAK